MTTDPVRNPDEPLDTSSDTARDEHVRCLVFAGGGTGGHLFPSLAIAEGARELDPSIGVRFLCSDKILDSTILHEADAEFTPLPARPMLMRPFPRALLEFVAGWRGARATTNEVLDQLAIEFNGAEHLRVVLMGGYVAAPVARSAKALDIHVTLVNLDHVPGKANRFAARWANEIISAVRCASPTRFAAAPVVGMPIRKQAIACDPPELCRERLGLDPARQTLLITGASQGAGSLNDLLALMVQHSRFRDAFRDWQILHLCGPGREGDLKSAYDRTGVPAVVMPFLGAMRDAWGSADLALSRAGASSVAEAAVNCVPTIFAPYPWHQDQHQRHNAEPIVKAGGGWLVEDRKSGAGNLESIAPLLSRLLAHSNARRAAQQALDTLQVASASRLIARQVLGF